MKKTVYMILIMFIYPICVYAASTNVRLNSIGFLTNYDKIATIYAASAPSGWYVLSYPGNVTVTSGTFSTAMTDAQTGETSSLYQANFSSYTTPGVYYLNVPGVGASITFTVSDMVYNTPFVPVFKAMYLARCGMAVSETYNGNTFSHAACHTNDAYDNYIGGSGTKITSTKGWHDAGDYNKYVVNAGITVGTMFMAWEMFGTKINSLSYGLPATASGYPEFLEELKWETDWLLTMKASDGSVFDKVSETGFDAFEMPESDTGTRYFWGYNNVGTPEIATFCAMMAMASRNFQPYDSTYAATCLSAATSAYAYLTSHTTNTTANITGCSTGSYTGSDANASRLWAAAEMWETTGGSSALNDFENRAAAYSSNYVDSDFGWADVKNLGMYTYALSARTGRSSTLLTNIKNKILSTANAVVSTRNSHAYGRPLGTSYYWGCNGAVAQQAMLLQVANQISANASYLNTALDALGYLLGRNTHDRSYVTGVGINPPMNPHHRPSGSDGITAPWPGYLVGGSPGTNQDDPVLSPTPSGLPAAKYWADQQGSYSSNEVAINWQGALIYAMAGFIGVPTNTNTPTPTCTSTVTSTFTATATATGTASRTCTQSATSTFTATATATGTASPTCTQSATSTFTATATATGTASPTCTQSATSTFTATATATGTHSPTCTATCTGTGSPTVTYTITPKLSATDTPTITETATGTPPTYTNTPTDTGTASATCTSTKSPVNTFTVTPTYTLTQTLTATEPDATNTFTKTATLTSTITASPTETATDNIQAPTATYTATTWIARNIVYPCPVNPVYNDLTVEYSLERTADKVNFVIYSRAFRLIRSFDLSGKSAGPNRSIINKAYLNGLSNGCYLYIIELKDQTGTKRSRIDKLIILK